jgi:peptidyl-tRNA hydrolase, PTH1 family
VELAPASHSDLHLTRIVPLAWDKKKKLVGLTDPNSDSEMNVLHILVAGLGNPAPYQLTRHRCVMSSHSQLSNVKHIRSVGNVLIESLARRLNIRLSHNRGAESGDTTVQIGNSTVRVTLYKSGEFQYLPYMLRIRLIMKCIGTFMNVSGPALSRALKSSNLKSANLILLHDSLSHKAQSISPKVRGSANGHNGVRSVISALGTEEFHRLRLGIGKNEVDAATYVLEKLSPAERAYWGEGGRGVDAAWSTIEKIVLQSGERSGP